MPREGTRAGAARVGRNGAPRLGACRRLRQASGSKKGGATRPQAALPTCSAELSMSMPRRSRPNRISTAMTIEAVAATTASAKE